MNSPTPAADAMAPAQLAKAALRRLVVARLDPTPENYARAYREEAGEAAASSLLPARAQRAVERLAQRALVPAAASAFGQAASEGRWDQLERLLDAPDESGSQLAGLIDRIVRGIDRRTKQWTAARKKESLQRVLDGSRGDAARLQHRLRQLLASWETDGSDDAPVATSDEAAPVADGAVPTGPDVRVAPSPSPSPSQSPSPQAPSPQPSLSEATPPDASSPPVPLPATIEAAPTPPGAATMLADAAPDAFPPPRENWPRVIERLDLTLRQALPADQAEGQAVSDALAAVLAEIREAGATAALGERLEAACRNAERVLQHRHHLIEQLAALCRDLTASLTDLAEDESWARGQCEAMRARIDDGITVRGVKAVGELLRNTRERQAQLRGERAQARDALKSLIHRMLSELGELGSQTGRFHDSVGRYAGVIERADSLESLAGAVREMVEESRTVQALVSQAQQRLHDEHARGVDLSQRVQQLEGELRRLSDEVSTDPLTQVANRRGLMQAFDAERARLQRTGQALAIGLLDIDNFKRLNDELGHGAGDVALKSLAERVSQTLRPSDIVARYGGEEFVVLLPETAVDEGQRILTRLQRALSGGLFMHEQRQVLVTFSAGVTAYRDGEAIEASLERADQALYEAKRTGKNRTCVA